MVQVKLIFQNGEALFSVSGFVSFFGFDYDTLDDEEKKPVRIISLLFHQVFILKSDHDNLMSILYTIRQPIIARPYQG